MSSPSVAVIDIGSNSIKLLVAQKDSRGTLEILKSQTEETRISAGINKKNPSLSAEGMARSVASIQTLLSAAQPFAPQETVLVATSAVRDATNGNDFRERVRSTTSHTVSILSGTEEANLIGRGLTADPALQNLQDFYLFDLGGGSLECLAFAQRKVQQSLSLQLGCVRLTERCVPDSSAPFSAEARKAVDAATRDGFAKSNFQFSLPAGSPAVATGGTVTTTRVLIGARSGKAWAETSAAVTVAELEHMLDEVAPLSLSGRQKIPGMPASRADVFPTALATLLTIAHLNGFTEFRHSMYNLRYGLASQMLERLSAV